MRYCTPDHSKTHLIPDARQHRGWSPDATGQHNQAEKQPLLMSTEIPQAQVQDVEQGFLRPVVPDVRVHLRTQDRLRLLRELYG